MATGISLHIGLNSVDPQHYEGWSGPLNACEADANDMADLAHTRSFAPTKLLTRRATRAAVLGGIAHAAKFLKSGDLFFLTYSGHGGQLPDLNGDEPDGKDETWCLYDGELVDDELYSSWGAFAAGVRILLLSDSCHSGSVSKALHYQARARALPGTQYRAMPDEVALRVYQSNRKTYDPILKRRDLSEALGNVKASVLLISGCQDNQLSQDGTFNGLFTGTLKTVWNGGTFKGSYRRFHTAIGAKMPPDQSPKLSLVGASNPAFMAARPFTIEDGKRKKTPAKKKTAAKKKSARS
ncbi:caspase family protein [Bradyrhizobium sp. KB893862 SZCCT0404]|uniref:caspase family protein n=1 Tax=Bradyrhizobium sp. KB893862 SZCCT0404 TaxID=2807672 RepID=UPI001BABDA04|nr:caspase family protein [Bradyrhizobium sp. KB893862 SZCCT0404]MBR1176252.1 caspase family protein [Bradyrhizobium sp. KB893862 SZCCT0404]